VTGDIAAKLDQGASIDDLCASHGLRRDQVIEAQAAIHLYRIARLAPLSPEARELVEDPGKFPYSVVFERLIQPKLSREALAIEISDAGMIVHSLEEKFLPVLARILHDAATDVIDTRKLHSADEQMAYVAKLGFTPGGGRFTADDAEQRRASGTQRSSPSSSKATPGKPSQRSTRASGHLLPGDLVVKYQNEKLVRLVQEGKKLRIADYPNTCACLLRTLVECALKVRLKAQRLLGRISPSNPNYGPSLADMLNFANQNPAMLHLDPDAVNALRALISRKWKESKSQLDRIVHSSDVVTHGEEMASIRQSALPLLREILRPPA
jgi:hypothetical protein